MAARERRPNESFDAYRQSLKDEERRHRALKRGGWLVRSADVQPRKTPRRWKRIRKAERTRNRYLDRKALRQLERLIRNSVFDVVAYRNRLEHRASRVRRLLENNPPVDLTSDQRGFSAPEFMVMTIGTCILAITFGLVGGMVVSSLNGCVEASNPGPTEAERKLAVCELNNRVLEKTLAECRKENR